MSAPYAPLLRVFWPQQLLLPLDQADHAPVELVGWRSGGPALQEIVVTGTLPPSAVPPAGDARVVGTLLQQPVADVASISASCRIPCFLLLPTAEPGSLLPVLLPAPPALAATAGPATRRRRQQADQQQQAQQQQCQVVLYDGVPPLSPEDGAGQGRQRGTAGRRHGGTSRQQLAASLASHLAGALLAALLLAHWHGVTAAALRRSSQLASFVSGQLAWFASSQPAGVKLHRQLSELLGSAGLHYTAGLRRLLSGRGRLVAGGAAGVLAASLLCGGLLPGLLALEWLLWAAGLPLALPYAAMAAALRWQLRCTALMWRVMRGRQRMPPLRHRLAALARAWRGGAGARGLAASEASRGAAGAGEALFPAPQAAAAEMASFSHSPGSGLKQLCGSMLLFMPLLLLLPTTAWYYGFALALHSAASAPRAAVRLARQLAADDPLGAALGQLLQQPMGAVPRCSWSSCGSGTSGDQHGGLAVHYAALDVRWAGAADRLAPWVRQVTAVATYLRAEARHRSPLRAALLAARRAWRACGFASEAPAALLAAALCGRPLFLALPGGLTDGAI